MADRTLNDRQKAERLRLLLADRNWHYIEMTTARVYLDEYAELLEQRDQTRSQS